MSVVSTQTGTYSGMSDLLSKMGSFLSTNGWTVKDGSGDVTGGSAAQSFTSTTWKAFYSNATSNPNTDWVSPGHEGIYLLAGINTSFTPDRLLFKCARWADFSGATVPGTSVVDHINPEDDTGTHLGIKDGTNSPTYYFVTDGTPSVGGTYFIVGTQENPSAEAWKVHYCGLLQSASRVVRKVSGTVTAGSTQIDLGSSVPQIWNPSIGQLTSIRLRIINQTSTGPSMETVNVTSASGNIITLSGPLASEFTDPIIGNDPQPVICTLGTSFADTATTDASCVVHGGNTMTEFGVINVIKPAGLTIPLGASDQTGSQGIYQEGFHNDDGPDDEWMRGGLVNMFYAKMVGVNEDFLKLQGSDDNNFQRFIILNLVGDSGDVNDKILLPFESESVGI